mmetsp:Transcript_39546/g.77842  ORF Transcript_39546/g.77842 Transcript_39546/m.77842 type:complete len:164 (+) Transcript_39546:162-653(+)
MDEERKKEQKKTRRSDQQENSKRQTGRERERERERQRQTVREKGDGVKMNEPIHTDYMFLLHKNRQRERTTEPKTRTTRRIQCSRKQARMRTDRDTAQPVDAKSKHSCRIENENCRRQEGEGTTHRSQRVQLDVLFFAYALSFLFLFTSFTFFPSVSLSLRYM